MEFEETTIKSLLQHPDEEVCVVTFIGKARIDGSCFNLASESKFYYDVAKRTIYLSCELSIKAMPFLHVSHLLVFVSDSSQLDVQYLQWFRRLDAVRLKNKDQLQKKFDRPSGRYCSPRALFVVKRQLESAKGFEFNMEDLIYRTLRRSRIVTNNCGNSLFAVPMSRTFVHVGHEDCLEFVEGHTRLAFKQGFNDNVGRNAGVAYFRLAQLHRWVDVFEKMVHFFRNVNEIDIDAKFSEVRCSKAYPVALQAYYDNLPPYYDEFVHQAKVAYALKVFRAKAKGPTVQRLAEELRKECEDFWKNGHETCKEESLTGHGCGKPIHATGEHLARVQFLSVCNCGRSRHVRNDPFSLIHANFGFYERPDCCADLASFTFESKDDSDADMTCSETPLPPKFSSWSCVCLGPSSKYSHKLGIIDQPGFFNGSSFLLPWDVKLDFPRTLNSGDSRKGSTRSAKIFIGFEYECPRGDRFMLSAPDTMLRSTPCGLVKETASKIVGSAMPLYFPCPCQLKANAQLMRLHVVTPKIAIDVTVQPRVQPAPSSPVFHPLETITLTQSSYWVIRLPYVYKNKGVVYRPQDSSHWGVESARLLGGTFSVATGRLS
ncbi:protein SMG8-like [Tropilaelaps mercedesae]|uniref:Nonsense-mediated mRNA decay factor SMG8 n=1 Tax=Tropilaelaps mercedesae TaxID=418985 RepID=A0A1V9Y3H5_9ACAR|nr:protein SMG8-like [Tropilaelaps mercedesae]